MAQIDSSIYFQQESPDILGSVQRGMQMGELVNKAKKQKAYDSAMKAGIKANPDGTTSFDEGATLSALAKVDGGMYLDAKQKFAETKKAELEAQQRRQSHEMDVISRLAPGIKDQGSYQAAIEQAARLGVDVTQMPQAYDPGMVDQLKLMGLTYAQQKDNELREKQLASQAADRAEARNERRFQAGIKMDEKMQGLKTPFGLANSEDDAKKLKDAFESKQNFDNKLDQMIALRKKHNGGAILNRDDVGVGKQLSRDLLLEYKNMAKLGVLSKSDEDIINAIIPEDPLEYNSIVAGLQGQDPIRAKLEAFKKNANKDFNTKVSTRTRAGVETAASGMVQVQTPDGRIKQIPQDRLKDAIAAGGKPVGGTSVAGR